MGVENGWSFVLIFYLITGAVDYFTQFTGSIDNFFDHAEVIADDNNKFAIKTSPNYNLVLNGTYTCWGDLPTRFSLLFKIKVNNKRFAVTLLNIEGQLSVTLDLCNNQIIIDYNDECDFNRTFPLGNHELEVNKWQKIGLAFTEDGIKLFVNCLEVIDSEIPGCSVKCNEDTQLSILTPSKSAFCGSQGEVGIVS